MLVDSHHALLATVRVRIVAHDVINESVRALCDNGSQVNIITSKCAKKMKLGWNKCSIELRGVGEQMGISVLGMTMAEIEPHFKSKYKLKALFLVVKQITSFLPASEVKPEGRAFQMLQLADEQWHFPAEVEMLLGAGVWADIIADKIVREDRLVAQQTKLGWVVFGHLTSKISVMHVHIGTVNEGDQLLDNILKKFWEINELQSIRVRSPDEEFCEQIFQDSHFRNESGRYVVSIPMNPRVSVIGSSREVALKRFYQLEGRLSRDRELREKYIEFMREYESLGHMRVANKVVDQEKMVYYIPHHCVQKKFRVVFDASCATDNGVSLNDAQFVGEKLQDDLATLIMRFRANKVAVTADIKKMFRQVEINSEQWDLQRIFWRESPKEQIQEYWLTVVTYGMSASVFNAVRAMLQCAYDQQEIYPLAAEVVQKNFYVDDLLTGANDVNSAVALIKDLVALLGNGGFELDKWVSNSDEIMHVINGDFKQGALELPLNECSETSVLGLVWKPKSDEFVFKIRMDRDIAVLTKRAVVSEIAKLYDPNGYLAPMVIVAKILIQDMWRLGIAWDEQITQDLQKRWDEFKNSLCSLENIRIPRWLAISKECKVQLHGFSDASNKAYGAVIYVRVVDEHGKINCNMITAKTRVAPVKTITIPRLELAAAELLGQLIAATKRALDFEKVQTILWTDSTIVLHWIRKLPCTLKTFVANRVASIQDSTADCVWRYVPSLDNSADIASRGCSAQELAKSKLWWEGPPWLKKTEIHWPQEVNILENNQIELSHIRCEEKPIVMSLTVKTKTAICINNIDIIDRISNFGKMIRITAYVLRFIYNTHTRRISNEERKIGLPTEEDQTLALNYWIKNEQQSNFRAEYNQLSEKKQINKDSKLRSLNPFIDSEGILRVGGRIVNSSLAFDTQHPVILSNDSKLSILLVRKAHEETLHGGAQLCIQYLRQKYWITKMRRLVKTLLSRCVKCFRFKQNPCEQMMGDLPRQRVTQACPFVRTGVDYAGPFHIKSRNGRCKIIEKGYVAVFVCLVTRAVHLEVVSGLTVDAFMAAFHRFTSRRGHVEQMMSDNGTTFVGADNELTKIFDTWMSTELAEELSELGTSWTFITPAAPHQGGIWEAAVKSMKYHMRRVMGSQVLTFEGLTTLMTKVEACLNSRPIAALSDDPMDTTALTPGHFLVHRALKQPLGTDHSNTPVNRLKAWHLIQKMQQSFWYRWHEEYLISLQQRHKWSQKQRNIQIGDLVLILHENLPPTLWSMGRVLEVYHGADDLVRSVLIKTSTTQLRRPIQKICVLPIDDGQQLFSGTVFL